MSHYFPYLWVWFGSAVAAGLIGHSRQATLAGLLFGLFLGPIGIAAAFSLDGRPSCPHCAGRLDGRGRICQHCQRPLRWDSETSASTRGSFSLWQPESGLSCPHCSAGLPEQSSQCPKCHGGITWAKGLPIKVHRNDGALVPPARTTDKPWSQFRGMR